MTDENRPTTKRAANQAATTLPPVVATAIVEVIDKDGNVKGTMRFTNNPGDMQDETEHDGS